MSGWHYVFTCDECQHVNSYWDTPVCPKCGDKKKVFYNPNYVYGWTPKVARVTSKSVWYNPLTWGKCEWEFK